MHAHTIVGYTFEAAMICPGCIRTTAAHALAGPGEAAFMGRPTDGDNTEAFLDRWAASAGIDRDDEATFDSDDFPKVVFSVQVETHERCDHCGRCVIDGPECDEPDTLLDEG